jgi:hypothetical protein
MQTKTGNLAQSNQESLESHRTTRPQGSFIYYYSGQPLQSEEAASKAEIGGRDRGWSRTFANR